MDDLISWVAAVRALASSDGDYFDILKRLEKIPAVDAIPVEWLCRKMREEENNGNILKAEYLKELIWEFHQDDEQEAQDG